MFSAEEKKMEKLYESLDLLKSMYIFLKNLHYSLKKTSAAGRTGLQGTAEKNFLFA